MWFFLFKQKSKYERHLSNELKEIFGFKPKNIELYKNALCHSSTHILKNNIYYNNERLEFIGDSVLGLVVSDILYKKFPLAKEGDLSIYRSTIVNRKSLNKAAESLGINKLVHTKSYAKLNTKNIGGNTLEALVGAVFYDRGYKSCEIFLTKILSDFFDFNNLMLQNFDYKSRLLKISQKHKYNINFDTVENCEINEKQIHFYCEICKDGIFVSSGKAWTKKDAEQNASEKALKILE